MKKIILSTMFLTVTLVAAVSNTISGENNASEVQLQNISGIVLDYATGEPLAGVKLSIEEIDKVIYSDLNGNFSINGLKPGKYNLTSSFISYNIEKVGVELEYNSPETLKIKLTQVK